MSSSNRRARARTRTCDLTDWLAGLRYKEFHAVLLGVAGRDLHQGFQVIRSTDEWLSSMLNADADKQRLQLGEPMVGRLTEQLENG